MLLWYEEATKMSTPTKRAVRWMLGIGLIFVVLWPVIRPVNTLCTMPAVLSKAASMMKGVATAALLYAEAHDGRLPSTLHELVPDYMQSDKPLQHTFLATPQAVVKDLPITTIIMFRVVAPQDAGKAYLVRAYPDGSVSWKVVAP